MPETWSSEIALMMKPQSAPAPHSQNTIASAAIRPSIRSQERLYRISVARMSASFALKVNILFRGFRTGGTNRPHAYPGHAKTDMIASLGMSGTDLRIDRQGA
jgi:hypothetical protein